LIALDTELLENDINISTFAIKLGLDIDCERLNLKVFLTEFCRKAGVDMDGLSVRRVQEGSAHVHLEVPEKGKATHKILFKIKAFVRHLTDKIKKELGFMKVFFMFMGPVELLGKMQKRRAEIRLNPTFNRIYAPGHNYWIGAINDNIDRGKPYYCPVGWQRWSLYVTDNFKAKFNGWAICYHGTKFEFGLSILLNGLKPATDEAHGKGVYFSPSVNYAAHPRYAEIKEIDSKHGKFFKKGRYIQFVLECRVHPNNITTIGCETLRVGDTRIDSNIPNDKIEWIVGTNGKTLIDFNDQNSIIVCTGLLTRLTDKHPALLPQSYWWFDSSLKRESWYDGLNFDFKYLLACKNRGEACEILFSD